MTRSDFLRGLAGLVPAGLLGFTGLQKFAASRRNWKAVLMVGIDEEGRMHMEFVNMLDKPVTVHVGGLKIAAAKEQRAVDLCGYSDGMGCDRAAMRVQSLGWQVMK